MTRYHITWVAGLSVVLLLWQADAYFQIKRNLTLFSEVYQEVSARYVDEVDAGTLLRTGIDAMLTLLDPYTVMYDEEDDAVLDMLVSGSYTGVGIEVGARGQQLVIIAPIEGYSAHEKGVRAGDVIVAIDGVSVDGYSIEDLHSLLKGEVGSTVRMTLRRHGLEEPMSLDLTRSRVEVPNVSHATWMDEELGLAYVALSSFGAGAAEEVRAELSRLQQSKPIRGLILDLRNNPGGLLDEAVKLLDLFLPPGELVVRTDGRSAETRDDYQTREPAIYSGALAVLQNRGSASSSEIVSGAVQDLDRGIVVGGRSFGKGLVQVVRPLSYNVALKLTVSRYFTPSGRSIQSLQYRHDGTVATILPDSLRTAFQTRNGRVVKDGMGIEPDQEVEEPESDRLDVQLRQGGQYFRFANEFRSNHDRYGATALPDSVYRDFIAWLRQDGFEYQTRSMVQYADLKAQVPAEDRSVDLDSWTRLDAHLRDLRDREFDRSAALVRRHLHDELLTRYESSKATNDRRLRSDAAVLEAGRILTDIPRYRAELAFRP
jgi:carboxyl-terminal processing protease